MPFYSRPSAQQDKCVIERLDASSESLDSLRRQLDPLGLHCYSSGSSAFLLSNTIAPKNLIKLSLGPRPFWRGPVG